MQWVDKLVKTRHQSSRIVKASKSLCLVVPRKICCVYLQGGHPGDAKAAGKEPGEREAAAALEKVCAGRAECIQQIRLMCGERAACIMGVASQVTQSVCH